MNIQPVTSKSIGSAIEADVTADIAALKADVASLKAKAEADVSKAEAWIKANWPHFVTWVSLAAPFILKHVF